MTKKPLDLKAISRSEQKVKKELHGVLAWDTKTKEEKKKADEATRKLFRERKRDKAP